MVKLGKQKAVCRSHSRWPHDTTKRASPDSFIYDRGRACWTSRPRTCGAPAIDFGSRLAVKLGRDHDSTRACCVKPVLARMDDASQLAFEVERLEDGRVVVYVPGAPDPWSGGILVMTEDRIEPLPISMVAAVQNLRALGRGTNTILHPAA